MEITLHKSGETIAEVRGKMLLASEQAALDMMVEPQNQGARRFVLLKDEIAPEFFDLKNGLAGQILQKFVNYRIKLAIVGDFSQMTSQALKDFIYECNQGDQFFFVPDIESALQKLQA